MTKMTKEQKIDRMTMLVAGRLAGGDLDRTYWADLIMSAAKACDAIEIVASGTPITYQELKRICG